MVETLRRIKGFNQPFNYYGAISIARNLSAWLIAPDGPGRIEQVVLMLNDLDVDTAVLNNVRVSVDGITRTILNDNGTFFWHTYNVITNQGVFTSRANGAVYATFQRRINLDYETTARIMYTNTTSPDPTIFRMMISGRVAR